MTDLEMTRLAAEAMGLPNIHIDGESVTYQYDDGSWAQLPYKYDPLSNDAQAMALVREFRINCEFHYDAGQWIAKDPYYDRLVRDSYAWDESLNRAIVKCVARLQVRGVGSETKATE